MLAIERLKTQYFSTLEVTICFSWQFSLEAIEFSIYGLVFGSPKIVSFMSMQRSTWDDLGLNFYCL